MSSYEDFLRCKLKDSENAGFDPVWVPDFLFDFQKALLRWSITKGRSAIFADCGLGKTAMQLVWSENVTRKTDGKVLILTPLAVSYQTVQEAQKFGIGCERSVTGKTDSRVIVTNYEHLHSFNPSDFRGVVCDESSILKNFSGSRRKEITQFMRQVQYRLCCTATAAPNDYYELGTTSEALGYMGARDMMTMFFKEDVNKDYLGWGRKTYRFKGHAETPFFRWVCSWARACRKPSDLGFPDKGFKLPKLVERIEKVNQSTPRAGMLFAIPANGLEEQREERRVTVKERCSAAAANVAAHDGPSVIWCHLNQEGDELVKAIPGSVQISGSMDDEVKEDRLRAFQAGEIRHLITKPKIGCFGLNWQHCSNVVTFPSHSWEQYYQAVRRCWRFGQKKPVVVTVITTDGEHDVIGNLQRKAQQADRMFALLVEHMNAAMRVDSGFEFTKSEVVPSWLSTKEESCR